MARKKTDRERALIINRIIELVKEQGRITTNDVVAMFGLQRKRRRRLKVSFRKPGKVQTTGSIKGVLRGSAHFQNTAICESL
ncbi:hypothetical protein ENINMA044M2_07190 [Enterobacter intestinihominis]